MGIIKTKGIVLSENNMADYDKMLTLLTPGLGKISCAAKGARRPKSLLLAGTQLFCFGEYILYQGASSYHINSCEAIEVFYKLRNDLDKLKYAIHIDKIIRDVTTENENSFRILQLFLNTLYTISETDKSLELILAIFKIRLLCILGFAPRVQKCTGCGRTENLITFSFKQNGVMCESCSKLDTSTIHIEKGTQAALQYIVLAPAKKIFSFQVSDEVEKELSIIAKIYLNEKLERDYHVEELF